MSGGCWGRLIPNTQNDHKWPLIINHLRAQGVGGVEGVGRVIFGLLLYAREYTRARALFSRSLGVAYIPFKSYQIIMAFRFLSGHSHIGRLKCAARTGSRGLAHRAAPCNKAGGSALPDGTAVGRCCRSLVGGPWLASAAQPRWGAG